MRGRVFCRARHQRPPLRYDRAVDSPFFCSFRFPFCSLCVPSARRPSSKRRNPEGAQKTRLALPFASLYPFLQLARTIGSRSLRSSP